MSAVRTLEERCVDATLLLALWARCAQDPSQDAGDKLRQMKLAFLAAFRLQEERVRALTLSFYRWRWGPLSNDVYETWGMLEAAGLVNQEEHFVFTRAGERLARAFYDEVLRDEPNALVRAVIDGVAAEWQPDPSTGALLRSVYAMRVRPLGSEQELPIEAIVEGTELLAPMPLGEARAALQIDSGWLETLALTLSPGADVPLRRAVEDFRSGRVRVG